MRDNSVRVRGWRRMARDAVWHCWAMLSEIKWREVSHNVATEDNGLLGCDNRR